MLSTVVVASDECSGLADVVVVSVIVVDDAAAASAVGDVAVTSSVASVESSEASEGRGELVDAIVEEDPSMGMLLAASVEG